MYRGTDGCRYARNYRLREWSPWLGAGVDDRRGLRLKGHILVSHTHWDHIQGIPFFTPFFVPENEWDIYAPRGIGQSIQETLAGQMQYAYFPVRLDEMGASIHYHELIEGEFQIDDITVRTRYLNHTALTLGFRLEADGAALVYASDHEPFSRHLASGKGDIGRQDRQHCEFLAGADLVIHDAQFTLDEYSSKIGWGHSTAEYAVAMCKAAGAARLALTHHDPLRTDNAIDQIVRDARDDQSRMAPALDVFAAAEGQDLELKGNGHAPPRRTISNAATISDATALVSHLLLMSVDDPVAANTIREVAQADDIAVVEAGNVNEAFVTAQSVQPSLIILGRGRRAADALGFCNLIRGMEDTVAHNIPIIIVADEGDVLTRTELTVADWLITPFSSAYARTRIRACLLRTACHWERAPTTQDEEQRLAALQDLDILDTPAEERFDRITRLAASIFNTPMALVSLVDNRGEALDAVVADVRSMGAEASGLVVNLGSAAEAERVVPRPIARFGRVDALVNAAAILHRREFDAATPDDFDAIFHINTQAPFLLARSAMPDMARRGWAASST